MYMYVVLLLGSADFFGLNHFTTKLITEDFRDTQHNDDKKSTNTRNNEDETSDAAIKSVDTLHDTDIMRGSRKGMNIRQCGTELCDAVENVDTSWERWVVPAIYFLQRTLWRFVM